MSDSAVATAAATAAVDTQSDPTTRSGTCYCGKVRVTVTGKPLSVSICHCTICQRTSGAPFGVQSLHSAQNVQIDTSQLLDRPLWSLVTSPHVTRHRCPNCGSPVYATLRQGKLLAVPRSLTCQNSNDKNTDDPLYRPTHHLHYGSRIFDVPDDDLPKYVSSFRGALWTDDDSNDEAKNKDQKDKANG